MIRRGTVILALGLLAVCSAVADGADGGGALDQQLADLDNRAALGQTTLEKLEDDYLNLAKSVTTVQRGLVFSRIAWMYGSAGSRGYSNLVQMYCQEALSYPLSSDVAGEVYCLWVGALAEDSRDWSGGRFRVARRVNMRLILRGLRIVLDAGAPSGRVALPAVDMYTMPGPLPPETQKRYSEQVAARQRAQLLNRLYESRRALVSWSASLYHRPPSDVDELSALVAEQLGRNPDVVREIMERLNSGK